MNSSVNRALVFQGVGWLGAYEAGAYRAIKEELSQYSKAKGDRKRADRTESTSTMVGKSMGIDVAWGDTSMFAIVITQYRNNKVENMLAPCKELLEYPNGMIAIHPRHNKLITALRTAVE